MHFTLRKDRFFAVDIARFFIECVFNDPLDPFGIEQRCTFFNFHAAEKSRKSACRPPFSVKIGRDIAFGQHVAPRAHKLLHFRFFKHTRKTRLLF